MKTMLQRLTETYWDFSSDCTGDKMNHNKKSTWTCASHGSRHRTSLIEPWSSGAHLDDRGSGRRPVAVAAKGYANGSIEINTHELRMLKMLKMLRYHGDRKKKIHIFLPRRTRCCSGGRPGVSALSDPLPWWRHWSHWWHDGSALAERLRQDEPTGKM